MFYGQRIHDKCYRRAHFDAGEFVEKVGTMTLPAKAIAYTKWAARAKPPITPVPPPAGMVAFPSPSSPATVVWDVRRTASGIAVRSTAAWSIFHRWERILPLTPWAHRARRSGGWCGVHAVASAVNQHNRHKQQLTEAEQPRPDKEDNRA